MTTAESNLIDSAYAWWLTKRPVAYSAEQHLRNPAINTTGDRESELAHAVSKYMKDSGETTEKKAWDALQKELGDWCDKTFPNSTPETIMRHLKKEVKELWESNAADRPHETADCIMLLLHLAHKDKTSARDRIRDKFEICKKRKWGKPDKHGVIQHVKEGKKS